MKLHIVLRIVIATAFFCVFVVSTQTALIFPGVLFSFYRGTVREPASLPGGVQSFMIPTQDGETLEVWKLLPLNAGNGYSALFSHGNGGSMEMFFPYQEWLSSLGFTVYSYDFRGYGLSSGWPSKEGTLEDIRSVYKFLTEKEGVSSDKLFIVGFSIGTAPAAYLASLHEPKALILLAPFASIGAEVERHPIFLIRYLSAFLRWHLPVVDWTHMLKSSCFAVVNGTRDTVISPGVGLEVFDSYAGTGQKTFKSLNGLGHNDLLLKRDELSAVIMSCLKVR